MLVLTRKQDENLFLFVKGLKEPIRICIIESRKVSSGHRVRIGIEALREEVEVRRQEHLSDEFLAQYGIVPNRKTGS